jgi:hypothetical protein
MIDMSLSDEAREAVAVEEQLKSQLGNVKVRKSELFTERDRLDEAIKASDRDHARTTAAAARSAEAAPAQTGRVELAAEREALDRQVEALKAEQSRLRKEIERHRGMHFGELAEVCEQATQDAAAKEAVALQAYEAYVAAVGTAEHLWNALVRDRNLTRNDPGTRLSATMVADKPPAHKLFPGTPIRPPAIEPI